jgi:excisionase family DNA binding protein
MTDDHNGGVRPPLRVREAAKALNLVEGTIRLWITQRRIGVVRMGRSVRIPAAEIQRLLTEGYVPAEVGYVIPERRRA